MIEVLADHLAGLALLRSHRLQHSPEFLAGAAAMAVLNLSCLQYLDDLARGSHPAWFADEPQEKYWQAEMRWMALHHSLAIIASKFEDDGDPNYVGEAHRIDEAMMQAHRAVMKQVLIPTVYALDFHELARNYWQYFPVEPTLQEIAAVPDAVRVSLGFGPSALRETYSKYLYIEVP
jgi:hypothetical protein